MKTLCCTLLFALSLGAHAFTAIPETTPRDKDYKVLQEKVALADKESHRFLDIAFGPITGSLSYNLNMANSNGKNFIDSILVINGKYFYLPVRMTSADNFHEFFRDDGRNGRRAGIYMIQSGFRVDLTLDRLARVVATMRIADLNGRILPALEYEEVVTQAQSLTYLETFPREKYIDFVRAPMREAVSLRRTARKDMKVGEITNGFGQYVIRSALQFSEEGDEWFARFQFANVAGRLAAEGNYILEANSSLMYVDLNGKLYTIPYDYFQLDNWISFTKEAKGIYMTHRGVRIDKPSRVLTRVVAKIRIAEPDGTALSWLEYHEDTKLAKGPNSEILIERSFQASN